MLSEFARLVGVAPRHAEDALYSERAARAALSRRGFLGVAAALAAGTAFSFAGVTVIERIFPSGAPGDLVYDAVTEQLRYFVEAAAVPRTIDRTLLKASFAHDGSGYWLPLSCLKPVGGIVRAAELGLHSDPVSGTRILQPFAEFMGTRILPPLGPVERGTEKT